MCMSKYYLDKFQIQNVKPALVGSSICNWNIASSFVKYFVLRINESWVIHKQINALINNN